MLQIFGDRLRRSWAVVPRVCHLEGLDFPLLLLLLWGYLRLLLQDFPRLHPDSHLQGAQKGYSMGLGCFVLPLRQVVPILPLRLSQRMKIGDPLEVAVIGSWFVW